MYDYTPVYFIQSPNLIFEFIPQLCSKWGTPSLGKGTIVKDILIVIFGIVGMIAGTYTTMLSIVRALS